MRFSKVLIEVMFNDDTRIVYAAKSHEVRATHIYMTSEDGLDRIIPFNLVKNITIKEDERGS